MVAKQLVDLRIDHRNSFNFLIGVLSYIFKFIFNKLENHRTWREYAHAIVIADIQTEFQEDKIDLQNTNIA